MVGVCTGLALGSGASPLAVVTLRTLGAVALFLAYFFVARVGFSMAPRERAIAVAIGIPMCLNNYLVNAAMAQIPVPLVVLIFYLWPAITSAASWLIGKERFRWRACAGLALAFAGVALALDVEFTAAQAQGVWLAIGAAFMWSLVFLLNHHFFAGRDPRGPTLYMTSTAAVIFVAACIVTRDIAFPTTPAGWAGVVGAPLFYAFAMIGIFTASARIGLGRTGLFMNFEPIAAVLLSALILGQMLAPVQLAGAALVVAALFLFRPPT